MCCREHRSQNTDLKNLECDKNFNFQRTTENLELSKIVLDQKDIRAWDAAKNLYF